MKIHSIVHRSEELFLVLEVHFLEGLIQTDFYTNKINIMVLSLETTSNQKPKVLFIPEKKDSNIWGRTLLKCKCSGSTLSGSPVASYICKSHTFSKSKELVLVCMIDYKDDLSIKLGVALSDTVWTPPALTFQCVCKKVFNTQGERKMLSS